MQRFIFTPRRRLVLATAAGWLFSAIPATAQDAVLVTCTPATCTCTPVYGPTLGGAKTVKLLPAGAAHGREVKPRAVRLASVQGLYRAPDSGELRVLERGGRIGELVLPSKLPRGQSGAGEWTIEYRPERSSKAATTVSAVEFVALLSGPRLEGAVVDFIRYQVTARPPHPSLAPLIAAAVSFAARSDDLTNWLEDLKGQMRRSLELYTTEAVEPAFMEKTLADGVAAQRIYRSVVRDSPEESFETGLLSAYRQLSQRLAVASVLHHAGMHDAFIQKMQQIGLARWSRPDLIPELQQALEGSARLHHQRGVQMFESHQYALALDEGRLATSRLPCNAEFNDFYNRARIEFVHQNMMPSLAQYDSENLVLLQQLVRELQSLTREPTLNAERVQYIRRRVKEGEKLNSGYLPLQLKNAEFLANIGELTASREVVTRIERTVRLGRSEAEEWLNMDATLTGRLLTLRDTTERQVKEHIANGEFRLALDSIATALMAEPENSKFLYFGAISAAVVRDYAKARELARRYLRLLTLECSGAPDAVATLVDIYRREVPAELPNVGGDGVPNWVSGARYPAGEAFYDPVSGSFSARLISTTITKGKSITGTEFRWEGFLAASIRTTTGLAGPTSGERRVLMELEPVYDQDRVYMTGIGARANSEGRRRIMPLRYLNSPDLDPVLAARFTGKSLTRGWAGNPFFHPFVWTDIFLFDLKYDELGRIKEAIPVAPDQSRPISPFSERLSFTWDGTSKRLLAISGARYRREMNYDKSGRLLSEKITHPQGDGWIEYEYQGDTPELVRAVCEDNFYDRGRRTVLAQTPGVR